MENHHDSAPLDPYCRALFDAVSSAVPTWIVARVEAVLADSSTGDHATVRARMDEIVDATMGHVRRELGALLALDVDEQRSNPLHVLRAATRHATAVMGDAGVAPVRRDEFDSSVMPDDVYAIGPLTWRDLSDEVHDAGIGWGAWKAATVLERRRSEGRIP